MRSRTGCANSSESSALARQNGQECDEVSVESATSARIFTPTNSAGATPIIGQRPIDAQHVVRLVVDLDEVGDGIEHLHPVTVRLLHTGKQPAFSRAMAAWPAMVSRKVRSSGSKGDERPERQSSPANSPLAPRSRTRMQSDHCSRNAASAPTTCSAVPETTVSACWATKSLSAACRARSKA